MTEKLRTNGVLTPKKYREVRELVGTRREAAERVGVAPDTIRKREAGTDGYPITREATVAMLAVAGVWES